MSKAREIKAWASFFPDGSIFLVAPSWRNKAASKAWLDAKHWHQLRISRVSIREIKPTPKKSKSKSSRKLKP